MWSASLTACLHFINTKEQRWNFKRLGRLFRNTRAQKDITALHFCLQAGAHRCFASCSRALCHYMQLVSFDPVTFLYKTFGEWPFKGKILLQMLQHCWSNPLGGTRWHRILPWLRSTHCYWTQNPKMHCCLKLKFPQVNSRNEQWNFIRRRIFL